MSKESVTPKATPKAASIDRSASSTGTPDEESLANQQKMTQRTKFVGKSTKNKVCWQKINKEQSMTPSGQPGSSKPDRNCLLLLPSESAVVSD